MKKIAIILQVVLFFSLYQCQTKTVLNNKNNVMSLIDSSFEKLDIKSPKIINATKRYGTTEPPEYSVNIVDTLSDKTVVEIYGLINIYYDQWLAPGIGWFRIYKEYNKDGIIKEKHIVNKTDTNGNYGLLYEFNEQGQLIKTTDFEKEWHTSFETITEIATKYKKRYNYKAETDIDGVINDNTNSWEEDCVIIRRKEKRGKRYWYIEFNRPQYENPLNKKVERVVVVVDDATGKELEKLHYFDFYNTFFKDPLKETI